MNMSYVSPAANHKGRAKSRHGDKWKGINHRDRKSSNHKMGKKGHAKQPENNPQNGSETRPIRSIGTGWKLTNSAIRRHTVAEWILKNKNKKQNPPACCLRETEIYLTHRRKGKDGKRYSEEVETGRKQGG